MSQSYLQHDELIHRTEMLNKSVTKSQGMLPKSIGSSAVIMLVKDVGEKSVC